LKRIPNLQMKFPRCPKVRSVAQLAIPRMIYRHSPTQIRTELRLTLRTSNFTLVGISLELIQFNLYYHTSRKIYKIFASKCTIQKLRQAPVCISFLSWSGPPFIPYGMHNTFPQFFFLKFAPAGETLREVKYLS